MSLDIDHVPFAYRDLAEARAAFEAVGLPTTYGGEHDNGATHMAIVGFPDQSYLELIAERPDPEPHDYWPERIRTDAGPADWAVRVADPVADCERTLRAGEPVHGPFTEGRTREDSVRIEWDRASYGPSDRAILPFAIADRTPLDRRVTPTAIPERVRDHLTGVGCVVLATPDPERSVERLRRRYRLPTPEPTTHPTFGTVSAFPGAPVAVAGPGEPWIDERLDAYPPGPCGTLLATDDLAAAREVFPLGEPAPWPDGRVASFDHDRLGRFLGVIERDS